jgi:hypothetical protein
MALNFNSILFNTETEAMSFVNQINTCKGFPTQNGGTLTWQETPYEICRFDVSGSSLFIGYGIIVNDEIIDCMTAEQQGEILYPEANIQSCSWIPPLVSGSTQNI